MHGRDILSLIGYVRSAIGVMIQHSNRIRINSQHDKLDPIVPSLPVRGRIISHHMSKTRTILRFGSYLHRYVIDNCGMEIFCHAFSSNNFTKIGIF